MLLKHGCYRLMLIPKSLQPSAIIPQCARLLSTPSTSADSDPKLSKSPALGKISTPKLVYESDINSLVKRVKYFSFSTSIAAMIIQPLMLKKHWATMADPLTMTSVGLTSIVCLGMFITPWLLHWIIKRHVHSIYYDPELKQFTAVTYSLFLRRVYHTFYPREIIEMTQTNDKLKQHGISSLQFGTVYVTTTKTPLLFNLSREAFLDQQAFQILEDRCPETQQANMMRARKALLRANDKDDDDDW